MKPKGKTIYTDVEKASDQLAHIIFDQIIEKYAYKNKDKKYEKRILQNK